MSPAPAFKICGLTRVVDARAAEAAGASYVGAILVPGSPRRVEVPVAAELASAVSIPLVVVTADLEPAETVAAAAAAGAGGIQLHGSESPDAVRAIRLAGDWELWKAVRVRTPDDAFAAVDLFGLLVDLLLLDSWHPRKLGGTGAPFDWRTLPSFRDGLPEGLRLGVAGGVAPENVEEAVSLLRPDLVDVGSGVEESPGVKNHRRIEELARRLADAGGGRGGP